MVQETGKSMIRRSGDSRFATRYFVGHAIDIGSGDDSLANYRHMFPGLQSIRSWDMEDGDAMLMEGVPDDTFDLVHSSHCLEHTLDPWKTVNNWIRICKPGGHVVIVVPDFDLYEQGIWPSRFNPDHKWCFSISGSSRHSRHCIIMDQFTFLHEIIKIELIDRGYQYGQPLFDQSLLVACEPAIEIIFRKC